LFVGAFLVRDPRGAARHPPPAPRLAELAAAALVEHLEATITGHGFGAVEQHERFRVVPRVEVVLDLVRGGDAFDGLEVGDH
jgi:hypothetical protein